MAATAAVWEKGARVVVRRRIWSRRRSTLNARPIVGPFVKPFSLGCSGDKAVSVCTAPPSARGRWLPGMPWREAAAGMRPLAFPSPKTCAVIDLRLPHSIQGPSLKKEK